MKRSFIKIVSYLSSFKGIGHIVKYNIKGIRYEHTSDM